MSSSDEKNLFNKQVKPFADDEAEPQPSLQPSNSSELLEFALNEAQLEKLFENDDGWDELDQSFKDDVTRTIKNAITNDKNNNVERLEFCQQMHGSERLEFLDELKQVQLVLDLKKQSNNKISEEVKIITREFDDNIIELDATPEKDDMDLYPDRSQVQRQYPISSHVTTSVVCQDDHDYSDDSGEYLEDRTEFVRNGFGRMSTMSTKSVGPGSENFKSVDEITISRSVLRKPSFR